MVGKSCQQDEDNARTAEAIFLPGRDDGMETELCCVYARTDHKIRPVAGSIVYGALWDRNESAAAGRCRLPVTPCHSIARRRLSPPMGDLDCHAREPSSRSWEDLSDRRRRRWMDGPLVASWCRVTLSSIATTTGVATASAHLILHSFLRIAYTDRLAW